MPWRAVASIKSAAARNDAGGKAVEVLLVAEDHRGSALLQQLARQKGLRRAVHDHRHTVTGRNLHELRERELVVLHGMVRQYENGCCRVGGDGTRHVVGQGPVHLAKLHHGRTGHADHLRDRRAEVDGVALLNDDLVLHAGRIR